jgi:hypothetical protein
MWQHYQSGLEVLKKADKNTKADKSSKWLNKGVQHEEGEMIMDIIGILGNL